MHLAIINSYINLWNKTRANVKSWLIGKDPDARKHWRQEEKGMTEDETVWMASPTQWTWVLASSGSWWWTREAWCAAVHRVTKSWTRLSDSTELTWTDSDCLTNVLSFIGDVYEITDLYYRWMTQGRVPFLPSLSPVFPLWRCLVTL